MTAPGERTHRGLRCLFGIHRYTIVVHRVGFRCDRCGHTEDLR